MPTETLILLRVAAFVLPLLIHWANGSVWTKVVASPPSIAGTWAIGSQPTHIQQSGSNLTFINDYQEMS
jgi:hypothetical protein